MSDKSIKWVTKAEQIEQMIRDQVQSGSLKVGEKLEAETALARQLGVHRLTVNKAMATLVREGLLRRVQGRGTFVAEPKAHLETGTLGVLYSAAPDRLRSDSFYGRILDGLREETKGDVLLLGRSGGANKMAGPDLDELAWDRVDGLVLLEVFDEDYIASAIKRSPVPVVIVDYEPTRVKCDYAILDNYQGIRSATDHLLKLGHKRIACVGEPPPPQKINVDPAWQDRRKGWEDAMKAAGHTDLKRLFYALPGRGAAGLEAFMEQALALPPAERPTAWVCAGDDIAIKLIALAQQAGVKVPQQMSFTGFGNFDPATWTRPTLTTCKADFAEMGRWAARKIRERRAGEKGPAQRHVVPVLLVERDSCAPPPKS
ncbi:MAG: hypothetical protein AMXMBFR7_17580 [Planctomycetota bacterium]